MKPMRFLLTATFLFTVGAARAQNAPPKVGLTLPEAVRRAEAFIVQNGYTNTPPLADHTKIVLEWTNRYYWNLKPDKTWDYDKILAHRKGSMEPAACAWKRFKATQYSQALWLIVFRTPRSKTNGKGRGVWVSESGDDVHMLHEDATFKRYLPMGCLPLGLRP